MANEGKAPDKRLPETVERALEEARASAGRRGDPNAKGGSPEARWLALIPVSLAIMMFLLLMPRSAPPEDIPLPEIDLRALEAVRADDDARATAAAKERLPGEALAVGSALRAFNRAQASAENVDEVALARSGLDDAVRSLVSSGPAQAVDSLKSLRAFQLATFLAELKRYEATGEVTAELEDIAGSFIYRMRSAGWVEDNHVVLDETQRRVAFKLVWTALVGAENNPGLALSLNEQRALYTLYITRPHPPETQREPLAIMRRAATNETECRRTVARERVATEQWRAEKIRKLGEIDKAYPAGYALGVAYYRAERFDLSISAFEGWLANHPEGAFALRAKNHLKAALLANGSI